MIIVIFSQFFTSVDLMENLLELQLFTCTTVNMIRKKSQNLNQIKIKKEESMSDSQVVLLWLQ
ncbi:hypothetical protein NQ314_007766 [Rhamnusium bicolor]|uniref:Uncharacterized protein n=1 Tax=Rhamnusium bicolor TaxID=1586634 RepID=A0AAV8YID1_9CUCU|nr:hypothetical protein NQ314_007766 [Rhamnusium bicolor]